MNMKPGVLLALVALGLLCAIGTAGADNTTGTQFANDIRPYTGPIGPDSSLYGLKLAFENLDDSFTFNQTERLEKEIDHSDTRIAELESALAANETGAADQALDQYWWDMNRTEQTMSWFNTTGSLPGFDANSTAPDYLPGQGRNYTGSPDEYNRTGYTQAPVDPALVHAQQMILMHQSILDNLISSHPSNPGLARAYNRSLDMEHTFEDKTHLHFDLLRDAENRPVFRQEPVTAGVMNRPLPVYSWNQTRATVVNTADRQYPGQADSHRQDVQVNYSHLQYPANSQGNRYGNDNGNGNTTSYNNRDTNSNHNPWFRFP